MKRLEKERERETNKVKQSQAKSSKVKQSQTKSNTVKQSQNNLEDLLRQVWTCLVLYDVN